MCRLKKTWEESAVFLEYASRMRVSKDTTICKCMIFLLSRGVPDWKSLVELRPTSLLWGKKLSSFAIARVGAPHLAVGSALGRALTFSHR